MRWNEARAVLQNAVSTVSNVSVTQFSKIHCQLVVTIALWSTSLMNKCALRRSVLYIASMLNDISESFISMFSRVSTMEESSDSLFAANSMKELEPYFQLVCSIRELTEKAVTAQYGGPNPKKWFRKGAIMKKGDLVYVLAKQLREDRKKKSILSRSRCYLPVSNSFCLRFMIRHIICF